MSIVHDSDIPLTYNIGTWVFKAPEVMKNNYDAKCDVWSAGLILYMLLSGKYPFEGKTKTDYENAIYLGNIKLFKEKEIWDKIGDTVKDLLQKMLKVDPN
jgi:calcium-dependent protein kinase